MYWLNGIQLTADRSLRHRNHSPDGFSHGYHGSGPAQLALAIMLELTGREDNYQKLKYDVIANISREEDEFEVEFTI